MSGNIVPKGSIIESMFKFGGRTIEAEFVAAITRVHKDDPSVFYVNAERFKSIVTTQGNGVVERFTSKRFIEMLMEQGYSMLGAIFDFVTDDDNVQMFAATNDGTIELLDTEYTNSNADLNRGLIRHVLDTRRHNFRGGTISDRDLDAFVSQLG
jgi:hypothetical protein